MIGAIIGDIVGSRFEWNNYRYKDFELFSDDCFATDDSIMTIALAKAILKSKDDYSDLSENAIKYMRSIGFDYPHCGYGVRLDPLGHATRAECCKMLVQAYKVIYK